ncbi:MAG TPA: hypothetical protein VGN35_03835 [Jatrophihabitantaceae bacterium]|jgi:hypothetical protein|nr:hypothetical protein [Jatrophihabitantaceae bacterium]
MTASISSARALRIAAGAAVLAPSVHNTQPWRFVLRPDALDICVDRRRRLAIADPTGRQMYISLGCALFNARVSAAAAEQPVVVTRVPDGTYAEVVARLQTAADGAHVESELASLAPLVELRQSNRRQFADDEVPQELIERLEAAAVAEGALVQVLRTDEERQTLATLSQAADIMQITDPRYRAELRAWTTNDSHRLDGVRAAVVPHVDGSAQEDMPVRDFDTHGAGWLPAQTKANKHQCLVIFGTEGDGPLAWLQAGEALERVWLEITRAGYVASLFTQVIEVPALRARLREELNLIMQPHVVVRIGRAPTTAPSLRRHLVDVLEDASGS